MLSLSLVLLLLVARTIVSGLVAYVTEEEMHGRMVLGLCNLPPRAMRGVTSTGMLLCASNDDHTRQGSLDRTVV